jgi:hypothetical protein
MGMKVSFSSVDLLASIISTLLDSLLLPVERPCAIICVPPSPLWSSSRTLAPTLAIYFAQRIVRNGVRQEIPRHALRPSLRESDAALPRALAGYRRVAHSPWGPWSDVAIVLDPRWPCVGYGHFMHDTGARDRVLDPGLEHQDGGEYAPI